MGKNSQIQKKSILCKCMAKTAFAMAYIVANSRCVYIFHQPEKPKAVTKLKKF